MTMAPLLPLMRRVALFVGVVAAAHFALAPWIPLAYERRHFAVPLAWAVDWLLFVRPRLPRDWKRFVPSVAVLAAAVAVGGWLFVLEGARRAGGWAGAEEWVWRVALALSLLAHWSIVARAASSTWGALRVPARPRALLASLCAACVMVPYGFTVLNVHRVKAVSGRDPSAFGLRFEPVSFPSGDLQMNGWWIPAPRPTNRCILVCHGISSNMGGFLGVAPFLHREGFNVLFFDLRGHGASPGHTASFGWHESLDVRAALKYLEARGQQKIALYGFSLGGASVNLSMHPRLGAVDGSVKAVVLDSTFARFPAVVDHQLRIVPEALRPGLARALSLCALYEIGVRPTEILPAQGVARAAPRPVLIIHGDADDVIPVGQSRELLEAARGPAERAVVRGAGHCQCHRANPRAYEARVGRWLRAALK